MPRRRRRDLPSARIETGLSRSSSYLLPLSGGRGRYLCPAVPEDIRNTLFPVLVSRHHEKSVREPIQVWDRLRSHALAAGERDDEAFGAAADSPRHVELGRARAASRKDEILERRQLLGEPVDDFLEGGHVTLLDPRDGPALLVRLERAEVRAQMKEIVLDRSECGGEGLTETRGERDADLAVQLVHRSISLDPRRVLIDPLPASQARSSVVARAGIDLRDARHLAGC